MPQRIDATGFVLGLTPMTAATLDRALDSNREAVARFMAVATHLSQTVWEQPVAPGKWSPGQIAEHLALTYDIARQILHGTSSIPALPAPLRPLLRWFVFRSIKKGRFPTGGKALKAFAPADRAGDRDTILRRVSASADSFAADFTAAAAGGRTSLVHPAFGKLALSDYVLLNDLHTRHHTRQIPAGMPH